MSTEQFTSYLNVSIVGMSNFSVVFQQPMPSCMHAVPAFDFARHLFSAVSAPSAEIAVCARVAPPTSISNIQSVEGREQFSPAFCGI